MIVCKTCKINKTKSEMISDLHQPNGIRKICKLCKASQTRAWYRKVNYWKTNKNQIRNKNKYNRLERIKDWVEFFKKYYGSRPSCAICDKQLEWFSSNRSTKVNFDHKIGNETITASPARWYGAKTCSEQNQQEFLLCKFGILCNQCNIKLPLKNRIKWLERATEYARSE